MGPIAYSMFLWVEEQAYHRKRFCWDEKNTTDVFNDNMTGIIDCKQKNSKCENKLLSPTILPYKNFGKRQRGQI